MERARQESGLSLAVLKPARITKLEIKHLKNTEWSAEELQKLTGGQRQEDLFSEGEAVKDVKLLQKLPFDLYYHCEFESAGQSYSKRIKLVDWEVGALYRNLRRQYGTTGWEAPFRQMYEEKLPSRDLRLMMGTIHRFPDQWLGISVIAPPTPQPSDTDQGSLF